MSSAQVSERPLKSWPYCNLSSTDLLTASDGAWWSFRDVRRTLQITLDAVGV
jgi:hypothetical protein